MRYVDHVHCVLGRDVVTLQYRLQGKQSAFRAEQHCRVAAPVKAHAERYPILYLLLKMAFDSRLACATLFHINNGLVHSFLYFFAAETRTRHVGRTERVRTERVRAYQPRALQRPTLDLRVERYDLQLGFKQQGISLNKSRMEQKLLLSRYDELIGDTEVLLSRMKELRRENETPSKLLPLEVCGGPVLTALDIGPLVTVYSCHQFSLASQPSQIRDRGETVLAPLLADSRVRDRCSVDLCSAWHL